MGTITSLMMTPPPRHQTWVMIPLPRLQTALWIGQSTPAGDAWLGPGSIPSSVEIVSRKHQVKRVAMFDVWQCCLVIKHFQTLLTYSRTAAPFTCRRCTAGPAARPFSCRRCTQASPDLASCDGQPTTPAPAASARPGPGGEGSGSGPGIARPGPLNADDGYIDEYEYYT